VLSIPLLSFADTIYSYDIKRPAIEISVQVLTSTFWPMSQLPSPVILPQSLLRSCNSFEHFYFSRHSGRRLSWQSNLGNADVRASFAKGRKYDLNVSTYALILLLLFEDVEEDYSLSYEVSNTLSRRRSSITYPFDMMQ
jgi:cullin 3